MIRKSGLKFFAKSLRTHFRDVNLRHRVSRSIVSIPNPWPLPMGWACGPRVRIFDQKLNFFSIVGGTTRSTKKAPNMMTFKEESLTKKSAANLDFFRAPFNKKLKPSCPQYVNLRAFRRGFLFLAPKVRTLRNKVRTLGGSTRLLWRRSAEGFKVSSKNTRPRNPMT